MTDAGYKNRGGQNPNVNPGLQSADITVSDLMNIRRKAMALTAEVDKLLGIGNKRLPNPDSPGYKRERSP